MKKVLIIGAGGGIAQIVTSMLLKNDDVNLALFLRNPRKLKSSDASKCKVITGDVLDFNTLKQAVTGQDIVYVNLAGDLEAMAKNVAKAMQQTGVKRIIAISSIGIYAVPLRPVLIPYRKLADVIEGAGLDYTILRPTWFANNDEVDYEITLKSEPEKGSVIAKKSLAAFIAKVIESPQMYIGENLGINKPNS